MKLRNRKINAIIRQVPENENLSQVLANSVESVLCPDDLLEESSSSFNLLAGFSSLDGGQSPGERCSESDVVASCPATPSKNISSLRSIKMKTRCQTNKAK